MWYWLFRIFFIGVFKSCFRMKVEGVENLPQKSNFIVVANHSSYLDPLVIMASIPKKIHCIALRDLYRMVWMKWFFQITESLPSGSSSEKAVNLLTINRNVGLFPEGGVSRDGKLKEFRRGAALLALKTGRPIVPCAIFGTFSALPFGAKFPKFFSKIKVVVGKPRYLLKELDDVIDDIYLQEGTLKIRNAIQEMLKCRIDN